MQFPELSPRRELQGPRPTPLRISKDSHKIRKPPIAPPQQQAHPQQQQQQQPPPQRRGPIIIYTTSPKVIHTKPDEFMTLVQSLTGYSSSSASATASWSDTMASNAEKACTSSYEISEADATVEVIGSFPGILSPGPSSLKPISPNFFMVSPEPGFASLLRDLSPLFRENKNYFEGGFMPSPGTISFFSTPKASPTQSFDFFNLFQH